MNARLKHITNGSKALALSVRAEKTAPVVRDDNCPIYAYLMSLKSTNSQQTVIRVLQSIAKHLGQPGYYSIIWQNFDRNTLNQLIKILIDKDKAPDTISLYISVIKRVLFEAYLLDLIDTKHWERIKSVQKPQAGRQKKHNVLNEFEFKELLHTIEITSSNSLMAVRDKAIFHLFIGCGLRRFELVNLKLENINLQYHTIIFDGKGRKQREVKLHNVTFAALQEWLAVRGATPGPLFVRIYKSGSLPAWLVSNESRISGLSTEAMYMLCRKYGLIDKNIAPHSLRRSYATLLDSNGADIKHIAKLMGHSSIKTTERYIQVDHQDVMDTVDDKLFKTIP
ncbi:tyrosine-type recombinase/integrase [Pseudoalteromonas sp. ZZD1]|uniref:tyrosine-type recombinase/integrase n=1 Tax=Pseudoalteromonas sp. ZZD1 TaxID=3139395 RepID=UPI003BA9C23E